MAESKQVTTSVNLPETVAILFKQTEELYATISIIKDSAPYFHEDHQQDENERIAVSLVVSLTDNITKTLKKADSLMNFTFTLPPEKKNDSLQSVVPEGTSEPDNAN
jgi:hypothetical protein